MKFYIVNLLSIFVWYLILYVIVRKADKRNRIFLIICFIQLSLISGMRDVSVGTDTKEYELWFSIFKDQTIPELLRQYGLRDIGYKWLNRLIYLAGGDYRWILWIETIFVIGSICYFIYKYAISPLTAMIFFVGMGYFNFSMNISRQMFAFAIVLFAFKYVEERKLKKFVVITILASFIHFSVVFCLILYPIFNKGRRDYSTIAFCVGIVCTLFAPLLWNILGRIIPQTYLQKTTVGTVGEGTTILFLWLVISVVLFLALRKKRTRKKDEIVYAGSMLLSCAITCQSFVTILAVFGRMSLFFAVPFYIIFPEIISMFVINKKQQQIICLVICILISAYHIVIYLPSGASQTIPYTTYF